MKRILTVQDLTCLGKCALTVALPIISAAGVEAAVLPTALLSVHTAFDEFTFQDLSDAVRPILSHWKREDFAFDAIYTGYLGSLPQLHLVSGLIDDFGKNALIFIDPVLGDHGRLYAGLPEALAQETAQLCAKAHVIAPNLTEACLLLGRPYLGDAYTEDEIRTLLRDLSALGVGQIILTGISFTPGEVGAAAYDAHCDHYFYAAHPAIPLRFHGTGDLFSSVCVAGLTRGLALPDAVHLALDVTYKSIRCSLEDPHRRWYGVNFEEAIPLLVQRLSSLP